MRTRYRLKLVLSGGSGMTALALRLFPNALTFVGYPTPDQLAFLESASAFLAPFGVGMEIERQ